MLRSFDDWLALSNFQLVILFVVNLPVTVRGKLALRAATISQSFLNHTHKDEDMNSVVPLYGVTAPVGPGLSEGFMFLYLSFQ